MLKKIHIIFFISILSFAIANCNASVSLAGNVGGGQSNLNYSSGNGIAELTSVPSISPSSVSVGGTITVSVPVDADTGYVSAYLLDSSLVNYANVTNCSKSVGSGSSQIVTLTCNVSSVNTNGTYTLDVTLSSSQSSFYSGTYTYYTKNYSSNSYYEYVVSGYTLNQTTAMTGSIPSVTISGGSSSVGGSASEGSYLSPLSVPYANLPRNGSVGGYQMSYYAITGLTAGNIYTITLSNMSANTDLDVYSSSTFTGWQCGSYNTGITNDSCSFIAQSTTAYITVYGSTSSGGTFTMSGVNGGAAPTAQGTLAAPTGITIPGASGSVGPTQDSFYNLSGLTIGNIYTVTLTGLTANVDLDIYSNSAFSTWICGSYNSGTTSETCTFQATTANAYLWVREWTSAGATFSINIVDNGPPPAAEGIPSAPLNIAFTSLPYTTATVAPAANSYYSISGLTIGNVYTISLTTMSANVDLDIYSTNTAGTWSGWQCGSYNFGTANDSCSFVATTNVVYILATELTTLGGTFHIEGIDNGVAPPSEGTVAAPLNIAFTALPHAGSISPVAASYYAITGLTVGTSYTFSLTGLSSDVNLSVFSLNTGAALGGVYCQSANSGTTNENCSFIAMTTTAYVLVDRGTSSIGGTFTLSGTANAAPAAGTYSEGTTANPVSIAFTALPYNTGSVDAIGNNSNYAITGLTPGNAYTFSLTSSSAFVDLSINSSNTNGVISGYICGSYSWSSTTDSCSFIAPAATVYIVALNYTSTGATLSISGTNLGLPPSGEGTQAAPLAIAAFPYNGQVGPTTNSFYSFSGLTVGNSYTVNVTNITQNVDLSIYATLSGGLMSNLQCGSYNSGTTSETCTFVASATTAYMALWEYTTIGATFTIGLTNNGAAPLGSYAQGFVSNPYTIAFTSLPYLTGTVSSNTSSYYAVTGLTVGNIYSFSISGMTDNVDLYVYSNSLFTSLNCSSVNTGIVTDTCQFIASTSTVYIKVLELTVSGTAFTLGGTDNGPTLKAVLPASYTFEAPVVAIPTEFYMSGTTGWVFDTVKGGAAASANSIASGTIIDSQNSCTSLYTTNATAGSVSFWYSTDSEPGWDFLRFYINGVSQTAWSGLKTWTQSAVYTLPIGNNELKWCYEKDGSVSIGADKAWVDSITIN